jgi:iron complex outermembrane recepter protein
MPFLPPVRRPLAVLCAAAIPLWGVAAQGGPPRDTTARRIEPAEIRGERGGTVVGGAAAAVVRLDSLRTAVAPSLAEVLRAVPLVLVRTNSRGEAELSVRGSESRQVGIMLDGIPLSTGWDGRADPSLVPLSGVSRLTFVRATATVLGGPNTPGGVIDLQLSGPGRDGLAPSVSIGSDNTGAVMASGGLAHARTLSNGARFSLRAGGGLRDVDGVVRARGVADPTAGAYLRTNTDVRSRDAFAGLAWSGLNGASVSALVTGYEVARGVAPELHLAAPRLWRYPRQARRVTQLRARTPHLISRAGLTSVELSGGLLGGETRLERYTDATYRTVDGREHGEEVVGTARVAATHTLPGGTQLRAAVTGDRVRYDESRDTDPTRRYRQSLLSAGAEGQWIVGARTMLSGGLVYERAETIEAGGLTPVDPRFLVGWRFGTTVLTGAHGRWHASASRRARFPALRELYSGALDRFEPNPDLRPERLLATETGVSFGDAGAPRGFVTQVAVFHHWLHDGVVRVGVAGTDRFMRVNRDDTRSSGAELLIGWRGGPAGPTLSLDMVAQRVRVSDMSAGTGGRRPELMPGLRAMLDGTLPVVAGATLGGNLVHIGGQYCVNPELGRDVALAAQSVVGVTLARTWTLGAGRGFGAMRAVAAVDNVADAAIYEQCGLPRAGRTLRLGVDLR